MVEDIQSFVEWDDNWATGIDAIDNDHKHLVELIQRLFNSMITEKGTKFLNDIFIELIEYTKSHFGREESIFEQYHYDKLEEHKQLHKDLVTKVIAEGNRLVSKGTKEDLSFELLDFLKDWLVHHIIEEDFKFKRFIDKRGIVV